MADKPKLSKRAEKMLERLKQGHFYKWDPQTTPEAMKELQAAGLVGTCGRVETVVRCWVPAEGYIPYVSEVLPGEKDPSVKRVLDAQAELLPSLRMTPATAEKVKAALRALYLKMVRP